MIKIHHLNYGVLRPYGLFPFSTIPINGTGEWFGKGSGVLHGLLIDSDGGLILVDTGFGTRDLSKPTRLESLFLSVIGMKRSLAQSAAWQVTAKGYHPDEVTQIFLTHMHLDHAGGLADFPNAKIHVFDAEKEAADKPRNIFGRLGYLPRQWAHNPNWGVHRLAGEVWNNLACTLPVRFGDVRLRFVPFTGHSAGHCALLVELPDDKFIMHAGDSYAYHGQIENPPHLPPYAQKFMPLFNLFKVTRSLYIHSKKIQKLKELLGDNLTVFCSHDPFEYEQLSGENILSPDTEDITENRNLIYHICPRAHWKAALEKGSYTTGSLIVDGFIHASLSSQVAMSANEHFRDMPDLVLLHINVNKVEPEIKWDEVGENTFPHIYGNLNIKSVFRVEEFIPQADGKFVYPIPIK